MKFTIATRISTVHGVQPVLMHLTIYAGTVKNCPSEINLAFIIGLLYNSNLEKSRFH